MKEVISAVGEHIESGGTFSEALSEHPRVFNETCVAMTRTGETLGTLPQGGKHGMDSRRRNRGEEVLEVEVQYDILSKERSRVVDNRTSRDEGRRCRM